MTRLSKVLIGISAFLCFVKCHSVNKHEPHFTKQEEQKITALAVVSIKPIKTYEEKVALIKKTPFYINNHLNLAIGMWLEARGEGPKGMQLVGDVLMNRVKSRRWGSSVIKVLKAKGQFDFLTRTRIHLIEVTYKHTRKPLLGFTTARVIADKILVNYILKDKYDHSGGALYYYSKHLPFPPVWAKTMRKVLQYREHCFMTPIHA
jgi:spore germination cell wall hydrolase CwlJ-like protein